MHTKPGFDPATETMGKRDIALIKMNRLLNRYDKVRPLCVLNSFSEKHNEVAILAGFGHVQSNNI